MDNTTERPPSTQPGALARALRRSHVASVRARQTPSTPTPSPSLIGDPGATACETFAHRLPIIAQCRQLHKITEARECHVPAVAAVLWPRSS